MNELHEILKSLIKEIPSHLVGYHRLVLINNMVEKLGDNEINLFQNFLKSVLTKMINSEASDIELGGFGTYGRIWFRIHGDKKPVANLPSLNNDESAFVILANITDEQKKILFEKRNLDFSYAFRTNSTGQIYRFRGDIYFEMDTIAMNMRAISQQVRPLNEFEFHPNLLRSLSHSYVKSGLCLVTGVTGSGKSTTLDAIVDDHNENEHAHIIVIASPVEFVHKSKKSIVRHREVGRDVPSFKNGAVESLRQDPDIIVVGEMRDPETIVAALELADTGHKVFSTLHTSSAVESIDRIIAEVNVSDRERIKQRLADVLVSVISQKLVPSLDGKRVLAKEVMIINSSIKAAIRNDNTSEIYMMIHQSAKEGMTTMEQDLYRLYKKRLISKETVLKFANNKKRAESLFMIN